MVSVCDGEAATRRNLAWDARAVFAAGAVSYCSAASAASQVAIGVTETIANDNPYADMLASPTASGVRCSAASASGLRQGRICRAAGRKLGGGQTRTRAIPGSFICGMAVKRQNDGKEFYVCGCGALLHAHQLHPKSMQRSKSLRQ